MADVGTIRSSANKRTFVGRGHVSVVITGCEGGVVVVVVVVVVIIRLQRRLRVQSAAIAINAQSPLYAAAPGLYSVVNAKQLRATIRTFHYYTDMHAYTEHRTCL